MLNFLYWLLCALGLVVCVWYHMSQYTKMTILGTVALLLIILSLFAEIYHQNTPKPIGVLLVLGIVLKLADRIYRKAIAEPRGWNCYEIDKSCKRKGIGNEPE